MSIKVRYFASLREQFGREGDEMEPSEGQTVAGVWAAVSDRPMPANTLMAVNQEYAQGDHPVQDGDEVAFFPPVTGG